MSTRILHVHITDIDEDRFYVYNDRHVYRMTTESFDMSRFASAKHQDTALKVYANEDAVHDCIKNLHRWFDEHTWFDGVSTGVTSFDSDEIRWHFNDAWATVGGSMSGSGVPLMAIVVGVNGNPIFVLVKHRTYVTCKSVKDYEAGVMPSVIKRIDFPNHDSLPADLMALGPAAGGVKNYSAKADATFTMYWRVLGAKKEETMEKPSAPIKALVLVGKDENLTDTKNIYVYSSLGIKRMSRAEYHTMCEEPHEARFQSATIYEEKLSKLDQTYFAALKGMTSPLNGNKLGSIYMSFRALWYSATKQIMDIRPWED